MDKREISKANPILHYEILFLLLFALYIFAPVRESDDMWFITNFLTVFKADLFTFLDFRYETWSTRLLLEAYTVLLLYFPVLYRISMPLWLTMIATGFIRLMEIKDEKTKWMICLSMLLLPVSFNGNAGFVCTTVNYVFTFMCYLWAVIPLVEEYKGKKTAPWRYVVSLILLIWACNMEYYCPTFLLVGIYFLIKSLKVKKGRLISGVMLLIILLSLIYAFTAPTSTVTGYAANADMFPEFDSYGILEKLRVGLVATAGGIVSTSQHGDRFIIAAMVFSVVFGIYGWKSEGKKWRWIYVIPLLITLLTGGIARFLPEGMVWRELFYHSLAGWKWEEPLPLLLSVLYFGSCFLGMFRLNRWLFWCAMLALFNRITMGASRSVFHSGLRTFYPLLIVICVSSALLLCQKKTTGKIAFPVFGVGIGVTYIMNFIYLL